MAFILSLPRTPGGDSAFSLPILRDWHRLEANRTCLFWQAPASVGRLRPAETREITDRDESVEGWILVNGVARCRNALPDSADGKLPAGISLHYYARLLWQQDTDALTDLAGPFLCMLVLPRPGIALAFRGAGGGRTGYYRVGRERALVADQSHLIGLQHNDLAEDSGFLLNHFGLTGKRPAGRTAFRRVAELMPGELLVVEQNRQRLERLPVRALSEDSGLAPGQWVDAFRQRFAAAVAASLPREGNVGIMASGGLDSGPAACVAAKQLANSDRELHAISWRLPAFPQADEWTWIQSLCRHAAIPLHRIDGDALLPFSCLDTAMIDPDMPAFNAFRPMINRCYTQASELGIDTILNASSGDHLYPNPDIVLADLLQRGEAVALINYLGRAANRHRGLVHRDPGVRHLLAHLKRLVTGKKNTTPPRWLTDNAAAAFSIAEPWPPESNEHRWPHYASQLAGMAARAAVAQENTFSNRFGVQRNDPFQDAGLIQLALALPPSTHFNRGTTKWLMREAMRGLLPEAHRTKARTGLLNSFFSAGFDTHRAAIRELLFDQPAWQQWIRREYVEQVLEESTPPTGRGQMVIVCCIGYTLWRQKLEELRRARETAG